MKKNILITAGPTIEPIDPVRYITNHSSGKMGYALAKACIKSGHNVILISGPTQLKRPENCRFISINTAKEMYKAVIKAFPMVDLVFKVAAVADYRVKHVFKKKIKSKSDVICLKMVKNPDILKKLGGLKASHQILVGFAAETHEDIKYALKKLKEKNLDWIVLNNVLSKDIGFGSDQNRVLLISGDGRKIPIPKMSKDRVASVILKKVMG